MLDSNAIIAVVSLFVMCVPGACFVNRVLGPRFRQWVARRDRRNGAVQSLPLHEPRPLSHELPVFGSSRHPGHMSTLSSSATFLSVSMADPHSRTTTCAAYSNACFHFQGPSRDS